MWEKLRILTLIKIAIIHNGPNGSGEIGENSKILILIFESYGAPPFALV